MRNIKKNCFIAVFIFIMMLFCTAFADPPAAQAPVPVQPDPVSKAPVGGFGVSLGPSQIRFSGVPGETQQGSVRIWNKSQQPMQFMMEISDVGNQKDAAGKLTRIFSTPGSFDYSCASWIQLDQTEVNVPAGEFKDVKILLAVPAEATGGHAAVVFFRGVPAAENAPAEDASKSTTTVQIQPRIGVLIFHEAKGAFQRTGKLENFKVVPPADGEPLRMMYTFENSGDVDILLSGNFYLLGPNNALAAKGGMNTLRAFPGDRGESETVWEGVLDPGRYHLVASFELGPNSQEVIVREADLEVPQPA